MAMRGRPIPVSDIRAIQRLRAANVSYRKTAQAVRVATTTAVKYGRQAGKN